MKFKIIKIKEHNKHIDTENRIVIIRGEGGQQDGMGKGINCTMTSEI